MEESKLVDNWAKTMFQSEPEKRFAPRVMHIFPLLHTFPVEVLQYLPCRLVLHMKILILDAKELLHSAIRHSTRIFTRMTLLGRLPQELLTAEQEIRQNVSRPEVGSFTHIRTGPTF